MTEQKRPQLTIVGMPVFDPELARRMQNAPSPAGPELANTHEPFPLTPYRDVHVPTPSHSRRLRERGEVTPVYVYPRKQDPTLTMRSPVRSEPSGHAKRMAAVFVCWALAVWCAWSWGGHKERVPFNVPDEAVHVLEAGPGDAVRD